MPPPIRLPVLPWVAALLVGACAEVPRDTTGPCEGAACDWHVYTREFASWVVDVTLVVVVDDSPSTPSWRETVASEIGDAVGVLVTGDLDYGNEDDPRRGIQDFHPVLGLRVGVVPSSRGVPCGAGGGLLAPREPRTDDAPEGAPWLEIRNRTPESCARDPRRCAAFIDDVVELVATPRSGCDVAQPIGALVDVLRSEVPRRFDGFFSPYRQTYFAFVMDGDDGGAPVDVGTFVDALGALPDEATLGFQLVGGFPQTSVRRATDRVTGEQDLDELASIAENAADRSGVGCETADGATVPPAARLARFLTRLRSTHPSFARTFFHSACWASWAPLVDPMLARQRFWGASWSPLPAGLHWAVYTPPMPSDADGIRPCFLEETWLTRDHDAPSCETVPGRVGLGHDEAGRPVCAVRQLRDAEEAAAGAYGWYLEPPGENGRLRFAWTEEPGLVVPTHRRLECAWPRSALAAR